MPEKQNTVAAENVAYQAMQEHWDLLHALLGGTIAMRAAGETRLPKEPEESPAAYKVRLNRSFLYNAYRDTIRRLSSKPFSRPVTFQGVLPEVLDALQEDVDNTGRTLTSFAKGLFESGETYGLTHVLVDYPRISTSANKKEEKEAGGRPLFVEVTPPQLLGWRTSQAPGEAPRLTDVRIYERQVRDTGTYGDEEVECIRRLTETEWELWELKDEGDGKDPEWIKVDYGIHTFGRVPLVTCYFDQTGFLTGSPPLEDLAWLNLAHWQSLSDQRNILRIARVAILFGTGFTGEEISKKIIVGPDRMVRTTSKDAKLAYVEHSGKAIGAGEEDLKRLEERMEVMGLQPLLKRSGGETATGRVIDESRVQSDVQAWIRSIEATLTQAYGMAAEWLKVTIPADFVVDVFNDFGLTLKGAEDIQSLLKARQQREITHVTFLREIKRRGLLSETVDIDEEISNLESEGPSLGTLGLPDDEPDEGEGEE